MDAEVDTAKKFCPDCGSEISTEIDVCPDCGATQTEGRPHGDEPSGRWVAAFIGSIFSFFFGWLPFLGPIFGGAVSGYLRGNDRNESILTGTLANIIASVPFFLFAAFGTVAQVLEGTVGTFIGWIILIALALAYFYGCGAVGGLIGSEFTSRRAPD